MAGVEADEEKWGVLWVPRWNIWSCITNKITSPNQPKIWVFLCNNVFWQFFRGWGGVIIDDSLAISRQSNCRQLSHFAICRQSIYRLSTFLPPRFVGHLAHIQRQGSVWIRWEGSRLIQFRLNAVLQPPVCSRRQHQCINSKQMQCRCSPTQNCDYIAFSGLKFWKILISIKYCINKNLAYRTPLRADHIISAVPFSEINLCSFLVGM